MIVVKLVSGRKTICQPLHTFAMFLPIIYLCIRARARLRVCMCTYKALTRDKYIHIYTYTLYVRTHAHFSTAAYIYKLPTFLEI